MGELNRGCCGGQERQPKPSTPRKKSPEAWEVGGGGGCRFQWGPLGF